MQYLTRLLFTLQTELVVVPTELRLDLDYTMHYSNNLRLIFTSLLPFVALVFLNYNIYHAFKNRRNTARGKYSDLGDVNYPIYLREHT